MKNEPSRAFIFATLATIVPMSGAASQADAAGHVTLQAESFAVGAAFAHPVAARWWLGVEVGVGSYVAIDLTQEGSDVDAVVTGYAVLQWRPDSHWQVTVSPAGFAGVVGNDFGAFYPSGRFGIERFQGRFGVGSAVRIVRIASGFGQGDYWWQLVPVRLGIRL